MAFITYLRYKARTCKKVAIGTVICVYITAVLFSLFSYNPRCRESMPAILTNQSLNNGRNGMCTINFDNLGPVSVNTREFPAQQDVEAANTATEAGGRWKPRDCHAHQKVAIIIPYRDRRDQLLMLLNRLHPMMQKQMLDYQIFTVEQSGTGIFNRGMVKNIGFAEALKSGKFDCFIFHDVDLISENDLNLYYCDDQARHLSPAIDEMRYHVIYNNILGGVVAMNKKNFLAVNGFSNIYWGWGSEDDDLSARTMEVGLLLTRPPGYIGRYKMIRHAKATALENGARNDLFLTWKSRWKTDGINNLLAATQSLYKVESIDYHKLYTNVKVDVGHPPDNLIIDADTPKESVLWLLKFFFL